MTKRTRTSMAGANVGAAMATAVVLSALLVLTTKCDLVSAERDFNFNDSQVPLLEPKDDPPFPLTSHSPLFRQRQGETPQQQQLHPYAIEMSHCHYEDSETLLSLVLKNRDWPDLSESRRVKVLEKLSKFFAIPKEFLIMESMTKKDLHDMQKNAIRKGSTKSPNGRRHLGRLSFVIGCGSNYFPMVEPILRQIEHQMKDGSIDNIGGERFGWWLVWRRRDEQLRSDRHRRQVEGSGEDDYEDDYEYGDDEEGENVETVTDVPPVTTHAHRHHHGDSKQSDLNENKLEVIQQQQQSPLPHPPSQSEPQPEMQPQPETGHQSPHFDIKPEEEDSSNLLLSSNKNSAPLDEDIVKSVSQLESVITKTIENTKNIKEIPVSSEKEDAEEPIDELEKELARPSILDEDQEEEFANEGERKSLVSEGDDKTTGTHGGPSLGGSISAFATEKSPSVDEERFVEKSPATPVIVFDEETASVNGAQQIVDSESVAVASTSSATTVTVDVVENIATTSRDISAGITEPSTTTATTATTDASTTPPPPSPPRQETPTLTPIAISTPIPTTVTVTATPVSTILTHSSHINTPSSSSSSSSSSPLSPTQQSPSHSSAFVPDSASSASSSSSSSSSLLPSFISTNPTFPPLSPSQSPTATTPPSAATTATTTRTTAFMQTKEEDSDGGVSLLPEDNEITSDNRSAISTSSQPTVEPVSPSSSVVVTTTTTVAPSVVASESSSTTASSTSIGSTDYVEPRMENTPPMIKRRLKKLYVTSGKLLEFTVPDDTFYDTEDMTNLRLTLTDRDGNELKVNSWLQFNAEKHEIYGLPLDEAVSKYEYSLSATDSGNETVTETVEITVQQHRLVRSVNHEINIGVKIHERNGHNIDWQLKLVRAIASTLGDDNTNAIVVREILQSPQDPSTATFVYFNETLPTGECPESELNHLVKRLDAHRLSQLVQPELGIKTITGKLIGACQKSLPAGKIKPTTHITKNVPPMPRNQVDRVNATAGHLLVYRVPSDTFYDPNDSELTLSLKTKDHKELNPRHWLQFDSKNQEFYGIPKGIDVGSEEYLLVAEDSGGLSATDALVVVVSHAPKREFSVYFKAYLGIRHEMFTASLQRKFVERIAQLFGDPGPQNIQIRSVTTHHDSGDTIVNFYNTSLYKLHNRCSEHEIEAARNVYLMQDHGVRDRVKKILGSELNLTNMQVQLLGSCHPHTDVPHREFIPTKSEEPTLKSTFAEDYMYTFILPAVVIVVMIVIASLVACCLHRRRRKSGKMELGDEEERKSFRAKGIPVIFQDELDEKPEIGNKSPIILKDEKPPLLPPSYNTSNMNGDNDVDEYVPPPAVIVGGREARGKSPATPSYRKPPPYVSP